MGANLHSITIPIDQEIFLKDNPELSLSKITQSAIAEIQDNFKISAERFRELQRRLENWIQIAEKQRNFIDKKGLLDLFLKENV